MHFNVFYTKRTVRFCKLENKPDIKQSSNQVRNSDVSDSNENYFAYKRIYANVNYEGYT